MKPVLARLLREDARRFLILSVSLVAWFGLIMLIVRNSEGAITAKTQMGGESLMKGFGLGNLETANALLAQMIGVSFNHPLVLALVGAVSVAPGARSCHGELARGTLEITLAHPISRRSYLCAYALHAVLGISLLMVVAWSSMVGLDRLFDVPGAVDVSRAIVACSHAALVFVSFAGIAMFASVFLGRRGNALFASTGVLAVMFAITFAERAWDTQLLDWIGKVSVFHGFDPAAVLLGQHVTLEDIAVPLLVAVVSFGAALWRFEHRDL